MTPRRQGRMSRQDVTAGYRGRMSRQDINQARIGPSCIIAVKASPSKFLIHLAARYVHLSISKGQARLTAAFTPCNCKMSQQVVTAGCHNKISQLDVTAASHMRTSQQDVRAGWDRRIAQQDVTAGCHSSQSQQLVVTICHGRMSLQDGIAR